MLLFTPLSQDVFPTAPTAPPSLQAIDSPFQLQEYLTLLIRQDPHNVERLCALPEGEVVSGKSFTDEKGKAKEAIEDEPQPVDTDVWIYEHLR